jgi:hypothetical protein
LLDALEVAKTSGSLDGCVLPRVELPEDKETMSRIFDLLGGLLKGEFEQQELLDRRRRLVPDATIRPIVELADKYDVTGLIKAAFCTAAVDQDDSLFTFQILLLGIAIKDPPLCRKCLGVPGTVPLSGWSQEDARLVGVDVYWSIVEAQKEWESSKRASEFRTDFIHDWRAISKRIDWNKALGLEMKP